MSKKMNSIFACIALHCIVAEIEMGRAVDEKMNSLSNPQVSLACKV